MTITCLHENQIIEKYRTYCADCGKLLDEDNIVSEFQFLETRTGTRLLSQGDSSAKSREKTLFNFDQRARSVANRLQLDGFTLQRAQEIYLKLLNNRQRPFATRARPIDVTVACCFYFACSSSGLMIDDFAAAADSAPQELRRAIRYYGDILHHKRISRDYRAFLERFCGLVATAYVECGAAEASVPATEPVTTSGFVFPDFENIPFMGETGNPYAALQQLQQKQHQGLQANQQLSVPYDDVQQQSKAYSGQLSRGVTLQDPARPEIMNSGELCQQRLEQPSLDLHTAVMRSSSEQNADLSLPEGSAMPRVQALTIVASQRQAGFSPSHMAQRGDTQEEKAAVAAQQPGEVLNGVKQHQVAQYDANMHYEGPHGTLPYQIGTNGTNQGETGPEGAQPCCLLEDGAEERQSAQIGAQQLQAGPNGIQQHYAVQSCLNQRLAAQSGQNDHNNPNQHQTAPHRAEQPAAGHQPPPAAEASEATAALLPRALEILDCLQRLRFTQSRAPLTTIAACVYLAGKSLRLDAPLELVAAECRCSKSAVKAALAALGRAQAFRGRPFMEVVAGRGAEGAKTAIAPQAGQKCPINTQQQQQQPEQRITNQHNQYIQSNNNSSHSTKQLKQPNQYIQSENPTNIPRESFEWQDVYQLNNNAEEAQRAAADLEAVQASPEEQERRRQTYEQLYERKINAIVSRRLVSAKIVGRQKRRQGQKRDQIDILNELSKSQKQFLRENLDYSQYNIDEFGEEAEREPRGAGLAAFSGGSQGSQGSAGSAEQFSEVLHEFEQNAHIAPRR